MIRVFDIYWHSDLDQYYSSPWFYLIGFIVTHLDIWHAILGAANRSFTLLTASCITTP
jgi:hypothetical protein